MQEKCVKKELLLTLKPGICSYQESKTDYRYCLFYYCDGEYPPSCLLREQPHTYRNFKSAADYRDETLAKDCLLKKYGKIVIEAE